MKPIHILIFDPSDLSGHHTSYIQYLIEFWYSNRINGKLDIMVVPEVLEMYPDLVDKIDKSAQAGVSIVPISFDQYTKIKRSRFLTLKVLKQGLLLKRYLKKIKPDYCLIMHFDLYKLSLIFNLRFDFPIKFAGIYFRPSFHYSKEFLSHNVTWRDYVRNILKRLLLSLSFRNPHLKTVFCLDPYIVPYIKPINPQIRIMSLPEPVEQYDDHEQSSNLRGVFNIEKERRILLMFGSLSYRKGILQLLDAIHFLSNDVVKNICLVFSGAILEKNKSSIIEYVKETSRALNIQIRIYDCFIPDYKTKQLFAISDLVLLPYQKHVGMSNILVRAAAAQIPVLACNYGLIGALVRRHRLGLTVDSSSPIEIATGIELFMSRPYNYFFDYDKAKSFAQDNIAEKYSATIFQALLP